MQELLKPCPFCGGQPNLAFDLQAEAYWIWCENEGCPMTVWISQPTERADEAINIWNTRKGESNVINS
jgi:hypothetical protein